MCIRDSNKIFLLTCQASMASKAADDFLMSYIQKYNFLLGIVISDKEGIDIYSAFEEEKTFSESFLVFVAVFTQSNESLIKLNQGKAKSITLFYEEATIYQENWDNLIVSIFGKPGSNVGMIYQISKDLKAQFYELNKQVEKIK
eukprot:TRINITY_DN2445_c0_g1_i22.p4 TRINITY_DN2445_c0_g1~~TRINITY_DN2445_c0_g1_i22.p4  ORF type:complete len:144 (+),score=42.65 TRINITY_DN2445_c0_g1_i22:66-497(+)